jgi:hypothetical protein
MTAGVGDSIEVMGDARCPDAAEMQKWLNVDETARVMLSRKSELCNPVVTPRPPLHRAILHGGNVLEIAGPSGSGKSEVLLQVCHLIFICSSFIMACIFCSR